jgi:hypothetical protein
MIIFNALTFVIVLNGLRTLITLIAFTENPNVKKNGKVFAIIIIKLRIFHGFLR